MTTRSQLEFRSRCGLLLAWLALAAAPGGCRAVTDEGSRPWTKLEVPAPWTAASGRREAWRQWAANNLQTGDIVFVMGDSRIFFGLVNFSRFSTEVAESEYSHVAVVSVEEGVAVVYDIISSGSRRLPFEDYIGDSRIRSIAIRRLRRELQPQGEKAAAFCRRQHADGGPFDTHFRLDNERYYCTELVEAAFRQAGLPLSEPIRIRDLPRFDRVSAVTMQIAWATAGMTEDQEIYLPGNDRIGIWSSPDLRLFLEKTDPRSGPPPRESRVVRLPPVLP